MPMSVIAAPASRPIGSAPGGRLPFLLPQPRRLGKALPTENAPAPVSRSSAPPLPPVDPPPPAERPKGPAAQTPVPPTAVKATIEAPALADLAVASKDSPRRARGADGPPGLHPLLVLLFSVLTLGGFGLYYAYRVCKAF